MRGDPGSFIDGKNFLVDDDSFLRKHFGSRKVYEGHSLDGIWSLYAHDEGALRLFAMGYEDFQADPTDVKLKTWYGGSWSELSLPATASGITDSKYWWTSYLSDAYFFNGTDSLFYDGDSDEVKDLNEINRQQFIDDGGDLANYAPVRGRFPVIHFNALWLAGVGEWKNTVIYSKNFSNIFYDIFQGNLPAILYVSVGGDDSASGSTEDEITCMAEWGADMFVGKNRSIHRIIGTQSIQYRAIPINSDIGAPYGNSLQKTRRGLIWLEGKENGFWMYDGQVRNISKGRMDPFLAGLWDNDFIRSGVYRSRYYYITINNSDTLIYDVDTDSWSRVDASYGGFARFGKSNKSFIAASNVFETETEGVIDPARPSEIQQVLKKEYKSCDIVEFVDGSGNRKMEADGTGGEAQEFSVQTPFFFMQNPSAMKTFHECVIMYQSAQPELTIDIDIDGKRFFRDLKVNIDPRPRFDLSLYGNASFENIPFYTAKLLLPWEATGYSISLIFRETSKFELKIQNIMIYYNLKGRYSEEKE